MSKTTNPTFTSEGYDILDQIAGIIAHRDECPCSEEEIRQQIRALWGDADTFYERFVGPMIDEIQRFLEEGESEEALKQIPEDPTGIASEGTENSGGLLP